MFTSVNEAFEWMVSFTNLEKKPDLTKRGYRLDKMFKLLDLFQNPQNSYNIIHVAGSKGKGSTCCFLSSILSSAGFKTGVYSSPHLLDYRERITNNQNFFKDESYIYVISNIRKKLEEIDFNTLPGGEPTTFELMTLASFIIFKEEKCQWVVLETGIGGLLDSTNVVIPKASVITSIELEHREILGNTIEEIATQKAGIIKHGSLVVTSNTTPEVINIIKSKSQENEAYLKIVDDNYDYKITDQGTFLDYNNRSYKLGLEGSKQAENALVAITTVKILFPEIKEEVVRSGLLRAKIPGRFQIFKTEPVIVLDGAHTKNSIQEAVTTFNKKYGSGTVIFGAITGKDILSMASTIKNNFSDIIISKPGTFKTSNLDDIIDIFDQLNCKVIKLEDSLEAFNYAKKLNRPILVTGSFYMAGEIIKLIKIYE